jgi:hypothetical protein
MINGNPGRNSMAEERKVCPSRVVRKFSANGRAEEKEKAAHSTRPENAVVMLVILALRVDESQSR